MRMARPSRRSGMRYSALVAAVLLVCSSAAATTVKELVRMKGQGESTLRGYGLVVGLSGTGDSGKELAMARSLAEVLKANGNSLGSPKELANSKSVAMVLVECVIPRTGALAADTLDVTVSAVNSASSLKGGNLYICALEQPLPDPEHRMPIYGFAQGIVDLQDTTVPTDRKSTRL